MGVIHSNAVAAGWWDKTREDGTIVALIHSELSEALEGMRKGPETAASDAHIPDSSASLKRNFADVSDQVVMDYVGRRKLRLARRLWLKLSSTRLGLITSLRTGINPVERIGMPAKLTT